MQPVRVEARIPTQLTLYGSRDDILQLHNNILERIKSSPCHLWTPNYIRSLKVILDF